MENSGNKEGGTIGYPQILWITLWQSRDFTCDIGAPQLAHKISKLQGKSIQHHILSRPVHMTKVHNATTVGIGKHVIHRPLQDGLGICE